MPSTSDPSRLRANEMRPHDDGDEARTSDGGLDDLPPIRGLRLRELLVLILLQHGRVMTVPALAAAVRARGFSIEGRAGKVISDQLRYEIARGRVRRVARGVYASGTVTRQARWRMQRRIRALRLQPRPGCRPAPVRPPAHGT